MSIRYNKTSRKKLMIMYGCRDMFTLIENNELVFHHLLKKEFGGKATVENGALMDQCTHDWLHSLEISDPVLFDSVNECLKLYKLCWDLKKEELIDFYQKEVASEARILIEQTKEEKKLTKKIS